jgi:uroporphyrinogen decarboxylase
VTPHERVLAALEKREADRVPTMDMMYETSNIYEILERKALPYGFVLTNRHTARVFDLLAPRIKPSLSMSKAMDDFANDLAASAVKMGFDSVWLMHSPTWRFADSKTIIDIYGRRFEVVVDERGNVLTPMYRDGVMEGPGDWSAWDKSEILRMPAITYRALSRVQKKYGDRIFIFGCFHGGIFEITWQCMGFERFVVATRKEKAAMARMIRFYTDYYCMMVEAIAEAGLPAVLYPDDLAFRSGPMLNPRLFDELYGEAFRRITGTAHALGLKIIVHTCGNVYSLLEWLADCGFDGIHGLEPTAGVELSRAKEMIGDRLCLIGNMDVTHVLVDGTRDEVREAVRASIRDAGAGGGYMVAPTNTHPGISVRRLEWMIEAVKEYGGYPLAV